MMKPSRTPPTPASNGAPREARRGRPPATEAGLVEARILDVATNLFLELGFGRTTLDNVSALAHTGKSAVYSRYGNKAELFGAVVQRSIQKMFEEMAQPPANGDLECQLRHVGMELARNLLVPRCISLMRITAAEAANFPELAQMAYQVSFDGSVQRVLAVLEAAGALDRTAALAVAKRFVELALQPVSFQAAFGADYEALRDRCLTDVDDAIGLLKAKGWLDVPPG